MKQLHSLLSACVVVAHWPCGRRQPCISPFGQEWLVLPVGVSTLFSFGPLHQLIGDYGNTGGGTEILFGGLWRTPRLHGSVRLVQLVSTKPAISHPGSNWTGNEGYIVPTRPARAGQEPGGRGDFHKTARKPNPVGPGMC